MTYSSRNFLISCGTGSAERVPSGRWKRLSSAMMSLQTSTHSSQMKTVGPAMSLRTSFWSLLQNEQRRISPSPVFLTMWVDPEAASYLPPAANRVSAVRLTAGNRKRGTSRALTNNVINNTVFLALVGPHDVVALGIVLNPLERLAGVLGQNLIQPLARSQQFAGVNVDIGRLPSEPLDPWLVDQDARIRQGIPFAL